MALTAAKSEAGRDTGPALRAGAPNDGVKEMFEALARRAFEIFQSNGHSAGNDVADWQQAEREILHPAHIAVSETDQNFTIESEVPGFAANEIEVSVEGRRLTISGKGEKHEERKDKKTIYSEHCSNRLLRVVDLPAEVNAEGAKATLKKGILSLEIAKAVPPKKIAVATT